MKKSRSLISVINTQTKIVILLFASLYFLPEPAYPQLIELFLKDTTKFHSKDYSSLDSLKLIVSDVTITGNNVTHNDIILREMQLIKGEVFTNEKCKEDRNRINNLGLFSRTEIEPIIEPGNKVLINVKVKEKWYIYPMPAAGTVDGDIHKLWVGASIRWQNFRGRNENVMLNFGVGYNPFIHASYSIPMIGDKLKLFSAISGGYSKDRNRSQLALGKANGSSTYGYRDLNNNNFDYYNYVIKWTLGKYLSRNLSIYTDIGYTLSQVTNYQEGRTVSPDGIDRYMLTGIGFNYDSRNNREFTTAGFQLHMDYTHFGLINSIVDFGRFNFSQNTYISPKIKNDYSIILSTRLNTSIAFGPYIPLYNHKFIGSGGDNIRGWYWFGYEGDN